MAQQQPPPPPEGTEPEQEPSGDEAKRCYRSIARDLPFCPVKDLNLPGSYEEVVTRLRKLQVERAMETLN